MLLLTVSLLLSVSYAAGTDMTKSDGLKITSPAFENNGYIPSKYTCDGTDSNPPLLIENVPAKAKSLALIVDDPDAPGGVWVHWVLWNIPAETKEIKENSVPAGAKQGLNDFRKIDTTAHVLLRELTDISSNSMRSIQFSVRTPVQQRLIWKRP